MKRILCFFAACAIASAQTEGDANSGYRTAEGRAAVARGLQDAQREERLNPRGLVEMMHLRPGAAVADVGTGVGYMLPYLSHVVGANGRVIAEDVFPDFLERAKTRARTGNLTNVQFVLGTAEDPKLPGDTLSAVLILDAYHHFDNPEPVMRAVKESLLSDGRAYVVEYYKTAEAMPGGRALNHIRLDRDGVVREIESFGLHLVAKSDLIAGSQYVLVFERR